MREALLSGRGWKSKWCTDSTTTLSNHRFHQESQRRREIILSGSVLPLHLPSKFLWLPCWYIWGLRLSSASSTRWLANYSPIFREQASTVVKLSVKTKGNSSFLDVFVSERVLRCRIQISQFFIFFGGSGRLFVFVCFFTAKSTVSFPLCYFILAAPSNPFHLLCHFLRSFCFSTGLHNRAVDCHCAVHF